MTEPPAEPSDQTDPPMGDDSHADQEPHGRRLPTHTVVIPPDVEMVTLLGPRDEMLRTMERLFPRVRRVTIKEAGLAAQQINQMAGTTNQLLNDEGKPLVELFG